MGPNLDDPNFGDEYRRRESAPLRAKRRRSNYWGFSIGTVAGVYLVVDSLLAVRRDGWGALINSGPRSLHQMLPWWYYTGTGLFLATLCVWILVRMRRNPQE